MPRAKNQFKLPYRRVGARAQSRAPHRSARSQVARRLSPRVHGDDVVWGSKGGSRSEPGRCESDVRAAKEASHRAASGRRRRRRGGCGRRRNVWSARRRARGFFFGLRDSEMSSRPQDASTVVRREHGGDDDAGCSCRIGAFEPNNRKAARDAISGEDQEMCRQVQAADSAAVYCPAARVRQGCLPIACVCA